MSFSQPLPRCCAVASFYNHFNDEIPKLFGNQRHAIAVFSQNQKTQFDRLAKKYNVLNVARISGAHGSDLAVVIFSRYKK